MLRKNFPSRREARHTEAVARQLEYDKIGMEGKYLGSVERGGPDCKESKRLKSLLQKGKNHVKD